VSEAFELMLAISCAQAGGSQAVENIPERLKLFLSLPPAPDCVFLLLKDSTVHSIRALLPHKQYTSSGVLFSFISSTSLSLPHASSCLVSKSRVRSLSLHYRACHLHQGCQETTRKGFSCCKTEDENSIMRESTKEARKSLLFSLLGRKLVVRGARFGVGLGGALKGRSEMEERTRNELAICIFFLCLVPSTHKSQ
jgi:hypothetical protein